MSEDLSPLLQIQKTKCYGVAAVTGRAHCQRQVAFLESVTTCQKSYIQFLSPPVHIARWVRMHRFLSACLE